MENPAGVVNNNNNEEEEDDRDEQDAHRILDVLAASSPVIQSQRLTEDEMLWAKRIKRFLQVEEPEVCEALSDFMIAQIAIVTRGNLEEALERAQGYRGFIEEYETVQSVNYGIQCVQEYLVTYNDFYYCSNAPMEAPVGVSNFAKSTGFASPCRLKGYFYILQCGFYDFTQIREGAIYLVDCRGFDWVRNFGIREYQQWWQEFGQWYPAITNKVRIFHSPTLANVMFSMGRKWLPEDRRDRMKFGCHSPMGPLRNIYCQPNLEMAQYRIVDRVRDGLTKRYQMEKTFKITISDADIARMEEISNPTNN